MRHAKSSWDNPLQKDFDRLLNERGKKDAPEMGKRLKKRGIKPDLIISSPAARAIKTAKEVSRELDYPEKDIQQELDLYEASIEDILHIVRNMDDNHNQVMFFGHNPTFTSLAGYLTSSFIDNVPTAGVMEITFDIDTWKQVAQHSGELAMFDYPKNQNS
jgi:phosphohistidine phosphatase